MLHRLTRHLQKARCTPKQRQKDSHDRQRDGGILQISGALVLPPGPEPKRTGEYQNVVEDYLSQSNGVLCL